MNQIKVSTLQIITGVMSLLLFFIGWSLLEKAENVGKAKAKEEAAQEAAAVAEQTDGAFQVIKLQGEKKIDSLTSALDSATARASRAEGKSRTEKARADRAAETWQSAVAEAFGVVKDSASIQVVEKLKESRDAEVGALRVSLSELEEALAQTKVALATSQAETSTERGIRVAAEASVDSFKNALAKSQAEASAWKTAAVGKAGFLGIHIPGKVAFIGGAILGGTVVAVTSHHTP